MLISKSQIETITEATGLTRPLRVVSISHSAFLDGSTRLRYYPLAQNESIDLTVIIPRAWREEGRALTKGVESGPLTIEARQVLMQETPAKWYLHFYPGMAGYLRRLSPDLIHLAEEPWSFCVYHLARIRDRHLPDAALVVETEQNILRKLPFPFENFRRSTLRRADLLIGRQREAIDVSRACGFDGPSELIGYVVDQEIFKPRNQAACRAQLGLDRIEGLCIGYVGRMIREKGLLTVLQAMASSPTPVTLLCMGAGRDENLFRQEVTRLGLQHRVHIFPFSSGKNVSEFMNCLDVLVLMSETTRTWKEQFGRVIIEAQACAVPVIGSDSGAIPAVVGRGGWIVREKDAKSLAQLLQRLSCSPEETQAVARMATQNVQHYTPAIASEALRAAFVKAYQERLGRHQPRVFRET